MATISENLQTIKNSTDAIKQAIIDKGGTIEGDITTWASVINSIESGGGNSSDSTYNFIGSKSINMTEITITGSLNKVPEIGINYLLVLGWYVAGLCYTSTRISDTDQHTLTIDFEEPIVGDLTPAICILNRVGDVYTTIPVTFIINGSGE